MQELCEGEEDEPLRLARVNLASSELFSARLSHHVPTNGCFVKIGWKKGSLIGYLKTEHPHPSLES